jgi:hypothetical protein
LIYIDYEDSGLSYSGYNSTSSPIRKSYEQFSLGDNNRVLVVNRLYYYDRQGIVRITPVFSRLDLNKEPAEWKVFAYFGHNDHPQMRYIFKFNVGRVKGSTDVDWISHFVDYDQYYSEPMQAKRDQMIEDVKNGRFDPADFGKVWVASGGVSIQP